MLTTVAVTTGNRSICCLRRFSHYKMTRRNHRGKARDAMYTNTEARMSSACVRVGYCAFRLENTHGRAAILRARLSKSIRGVHISSEGSDCGKIEDPIHRSARCKCATNPKIMGKSSYLCLRGCNKFLYQIRIENF